MADARARERVGVMPPPMIVQPQPAATSELTAAETVLPGPRRGLAIEKPQNRMRSPKRTTRPAENPSELPTVSAPSTAVLPLLAWPPSR